MGQSVLAVGRHFVGARARMTHQLTASAWAVPHSKKRAETRNFKKISKRNLPNVGIGGWMEALQLDDKLSTQTRRAHSTALLHFTQPSLHK